MATKKLEYFRIEASKIYIDISTLVVTVRTRSVEVPGTRCHVIHEYLIR